MSSDLPWYLQALRPGDYLSRPYLVLDFETTTHREDGNFGSALDPKNDLVLSCWKWNTGGVCSFFGGVYEQEALRTDIEKLIEMQGVLVAHNAKYELQWLCRLGVDIDDLLVFDTKIAEYVLLGNLAAGDGKRGLPGRSTSLDACCRRRGLPAKEEVIDTLMKNKACPSTMPRSWLEDRCRRDVETTELVFLDQRQHLRRTNRLPVLFTRCLFTTVLAQMEFNGMCLDADRVEQEHAKYAEKLAMLEAELDRITGGLNTNSSEQMADFIYNTLGFEELTDYRGRPKRTPAGKPKVDKETIAALEPKTEKQRKFKDLKLQIGQVSSALSKSLDFYLGVVREYDSIFLAQFNQTVTATHRTSSSGIPLWFEVFQAKRSAQFQNQPRAFKRLFCARRAGWLVFEADAPQLEFVVAGHLGRDKQLQQDVLDPRFDAHIHTLTVMLNNGFDQEAYDDLFDRYKSGDPEVKKQRASNTLTKSHTFKPLYGGSKGTPEQERYYQVFRERYSMLTAAQEQWLSEVQATGKFITEWGMRFYFPHCRTNKHGYCNVTSAVFNYAIQSLATAEIIPISIVYLWHKLRRSKIRDLVLLTNTVHDSGVGEVHPDAVDELHELCKQAFIHDVYHYLQKVYGIKFSMPLGVGFTVGKNWGEGKETKTVELPDWDIQEAA